MAKDVRALVSHISQFITLEPGDLILTGTPSATPPLADGDVVVMTIEGIGVAYQPRGGRETLRASVRGEG